MSTSLRVKDVILHGESEGKTFYDIIVQGKPFGMMTFDDCIIELFEKGYVTENVAIQYASNRATVGRGIDLVRKGRGEETTTIGTLEVDRGYGRPGAGKDPWRQR